MVPHDDIPVHDVVKPIVSDCPFLPLCEYIAPAVLLPSLFSESLICWLSSENTDEEESSLL